VTASLPRSVALGAIALPFFGLPIPLTIAAPDVWAGYSVHLQSAAGLAMLGAALGAVTWRLRAWDPDGADAAPALRLAGRWLLALLVARVATGASTLALRAPALAVAAGWGVVVGEPPPETAGLPAIAAGALLLFRAGASPYPVRSRLVAALALTVWPALLWGMVWFGLPVAPGVLQPLGLLALAAAWGRLPVPPRAWAGLSGVGGAWVGVAGGAAAAQSAMAVPNAVLSIPWTWPGLGGAIGAGVGAGAALGLEFAWAKRPRWTVPAAPRWSQLLGAVTMLPLAAGSAAAAVLCASAWAGLLGGAPASGGGPQLPIVPPLAAIPWALLLLARFGRAGLDAERLPLARAAAALGWASLVAASAVGRGAMGPFVVAGAVCLASAALPSARLAPLARAGLVPTGLLAGPAAWAYLQANALGWAPGRSSIPVGALAGALAALAIEAWLRRQRGGVLAVLGGRALLLLSPMLPMFVGIALGIEPGVMAAAAVGAAVAVLLPGRGPLKRLPALPPVAGLWLLFHVGFAVVMTFKNGPSADACAAVENTTAATPIIRHYDQDEEYTATHAYDVIPVLEANSVLVSFKRINLQGGFLEMRPLDHPKLRHRVDTSREGGALWPERFVRMPGAAEVLVQLIGAHAHGLWQVGVEPDPVNRVPRLVRRREASLKWEPANPAIDVRRNRVVMAYVPNWKTDNPLLEVIDLATLSPTGRTPEPRRRIQMADFVAVDEAAGRYYVPALLDLLRFAVVEIDADTLEPLRTLDTFHATVGIAADQRRDRLWLTNPIAGTVEAWRLSDGTRVGSVPAGRFPRDLEYDAARGRLHVGSYGDGRVFTWQLGGDAEFTVLQDEPVGPLLRGIGQDPRTGRLFAASGCGVYELPPLGP